MLAQPADRDIFAEPITANSKRSPCPTALSLWLECNIPVVKLSAKDAMAAIIKTHKKITSFFLQKSPPGLPGESHPNKTDSGKLGPV